MLLVLVCTWVPVVLAEEPAIAGLGHVELRVSDAERSLNFYSKVFGAASWSRSGDGSYWLAIGEAYLIFRESGDTGVSRTAFAVAGFDTQVLGNYLRTRQIRVLDQNDSLLTVTDGDGIQSALVSAAYPQEQLDLLKAGSGEPGIFQALLLDEVHIMVSNLEVDSLFYSRLLGRTGAQQAGSLWYDLQRGRLRLTQVPPGQSAGVNYLSILVANTDLDSASERVFAAGGLIENLHPNGFSFWDPDGMRVLVRTTSLH
jgi:catechol-2,3-dioxygenase